MTGEGVKVFVMSLGCDKNLADTEHMMGIMAADGYSFTQDEEEADVIIINTCCFINDAKEESVNALLELAEYKKSGKCSALIVTGCLAQRYKNEIMEEIPEVDAVISMNSEGALPETLMRILDGTQVERMIGDATPGVYDPDMEPVVLLVPEMEFAFYVKVKKVVWEATYAFGKETFTEGCIQTYNPETGEWVDPAKLDLDYVSTNPEMSE